MRLLRALRAYIQTLFILIAQIDNLSYFFNRRQVLPHALEVLSEAGYSLVTVAECLGLDAYNSTSSYICSRFNEIPLISAPCSLVRIGVGSPGVPDVRSLSPIPFLNNLTCILMCVLLVTGLMDVLNAPSHHICIMTHRWTLNRLIDTKLTYITIETISGLFHGIFVAFLCQSPAAHIHTYRRFINT